MTETDIIFKFYQEGERPNPNCFCHYGWEGIGSFAFWKYAHAYYDSAETLFVNLLNQVATMQFLTELDLLYAFYIAIT